MGLLRREKGQAMVEFALVIPLFVLILCGVLDFGWYFFSTLTVENCAREGARYGAVQASNTDCADKVEARIQAMIPGNFKDLEVDVTFSSPYTPAEGDITVSVSAYVSTLTPILGLFYPDQKIPLQSAVTMKAES